MLCEHFKDALIEAAASGVVLADARALDARLVALRQHLESCPSCRSAFDEEQAFFAAIDSGLHADANAEVPPSLLPRVRANLSDAAVAHPRWSSGWFALGGAAVAAAAFFFVVTTLQNNPRPAPTSLVGNRTPAPQIFSSEQGTSSTASSKERNSALRTPVATARNSGGPAKLETDKPTPETLVPRDQEILLASYAQQWTSRTRAPLVANEVDDVRLEPLQVPPIQIPHLDVKPLAEEGSR